jgi:hypothetical protein
MQLMEKTLRSDELLRADIRDSGDIQVTGSTPRGARLAYLDRCESPTAYQVSVHHVNPGDDVPAEEAEHIVIGGPNTVVTLSEVAE